MPCRGSVFMGPFAAAATPPRPAASQRPSSSFMQISRFNCLAGAFWLRRAVPAFFVRGWFVSEGLDTYLNQQLQQHIK